MPPRRNLRPWILLLLVAACGTATDGPSADGGPRTLVLSSSEAEFTPLEDGGVIKVYQGPQGGFHVFLAVRTTGLEPGTMQPAVPCTGTMHTGNPCIAFEVRQPGVSEPIDFFVPLELALDATATAGLFELSPPRLVTLDIGGLIDVDGQPLTIFAEVVDRYDRRATATVTVTAQGVSLQTPADAGPPDAPP